MRSFSRLSRRRKVACYSAPTSVMAILPALRRCFRSRSPGELPPWRIVWHYLSEDVQDDLGTKPGQQPTNRSNRFEVASTINAAVSSPASPRSILVSFQSRWLRLCSAEKATAAFVCASGTIASLRITDRRAKSDTPFRLFGTGSVGSQVLTGIPRLESIRFDPQFAGCSAVWPFETGWAPATGSWLDPELRVLHAEIYPSVRAPPPRSHQGPRSGARHVALGARPRRKEFTHQGIRNSAGHHERISRRIP